MKLLGTNTSPYVRKVRLVLLEKSIPHEYLIAPPREQASQVARANPLGRTRLWPRGSHGSANAPVFAPHRGEAAVSELNCLFPFT